MQNEEKRQKNGLKNGKSQLAKNPKKRRPKKTGRKNGGNWTKIR